MNASERQRIRIAFEGAEYGVEGRREQRRDGFAIELTRDSESSTCNVRLLGSGARRLALVDGRVVRLALEESRETRSLVCAGAVRSARLGEGSARTSGRATKSATNLLSAPMPGRVVSVRVRAGDSVQQGTLLLVIEAMKMQNELFADAAGSVATIAVKEGDTVERGATLLRFA